MRRLVYALLALAVPTGTALAATYGSGTFQGTVKPLAGTHHPAGNPTSAVEVVVKPGKARIAQIGLIFDCAGSGYELPSPFKVTASSAYVHVRRGPAGGGAIAKPRKVITVNGTTYTIGGEVFLGLRSSTVLGNVGATLSKKGAVTLCTDESRVFTAHRRR